MLAMVGAGIGGGLFLVTIPDLRCLPASFYLSSCCHILAGVPATLSDNVTLTIMERAECVPSAGRVQLLTRGQLTLLHVNPIKQSGQALLTSAH